MKSIDDKKDFFLWNLWFDTNIKHFSMNWFILRAYNVMEVDGLVMFLVLLFEMSSASPIPLPQSVNEALFKFWWLAVGLALGAISTGHVFYTAVQSNCTVSPQSNPPDSTQVMYQCTVKKLVWGLTCHGTTAVSLCEDLVLSTCTCDNGFDDCAHFRPTKYKYREVIVAKTRKQGEVSARMSRSCLGEDITPKVPNHALA